MIDFNFDWLVYTLGGIFNSMHLYGYKALLIIFSTLPLTTS